MLNQGGFTRLFVAHYGNRVNELLIMFFGCFLDRFGSDNETASVIGWPHDLVGVVSVSLLCALEAEANALVRGRLTLQLSQTSQLFAWIVSWLALLVFVRSQVTESAVVACFELLGPGSPQITQCDGLFGLLLIKLQPSFIFFLLRSCHLSCLFTLN